jgi:hypothetical protein
MLPLVPRKVGIDGFRGMLLVPCWALQNWCHQLVASALSHRVLEPDRDRTRKARRATLLVVSPEAKEKAEGLQI